MPVPTTAINVPEAVRLYNAGWTYARLGERYGVSRQRIEQKLRGQVRHERRPVVQVACIRCGVEFTSTNCGRQYCPACRVVRHRESVMLAQTEPCTCGRRKRRGLALCARCSGKQYFMDVELCGKLYSLGYGCPDIAKLFGVTLMSAWRAVQRAGCITRKSKAGALSARATRERCPIATVARRLRNGSKP